MCFKTICSNANPSVGALCLSLAVDNGSSALCWVFLHRKEKMKRFGVWCVGQDMSVACTEDFLPPQQCGEDILCWTRLDLFQG